MRVGAGMWARKGACGRTPAHVRTDARRRQQHTNMNPCHSQHLASTWLAEPMLAHSHQPRPPCKAGRPFRCPATCPQLPTPCPPSDATCMRPCECECEIPLRTLRCHIVGAANNVGEHLALLRGARSRACAPLSQSRVCVRSVWACSVLG
eukprot:365370-Chlamydomonas_euryale.AAC.17